MSTTIENRLPDTRAFDVASQLDELTLTRLDFAVLAEEYKDPIDLRGEVFGRVRSGYSEVAGARGELLFDTMIESFYTNTDIGLTEVNSQARALRRTLGEIIADPDSIYTLLAGLAEVNSIKRDREANKPPVYQTLEEFEAAESAQLTSMRQVEPSVEDKPFVYRTLEDFMATETPQPTSVRKVRPSPQDIPSVIDVEDQLAPLTEKVGRVIGTHIPPTTPEDAAIRISQHLNNRQARVKNLVDERLTKGKAPGIGILSRRVNLASEEALKVIAGTNEYEDERQADIHDEPETKVRPVVATSIAASENVFAEAAITPQAVSQSAKPSSAHQKPLIVHAGTKLQGQVVTNGGNTRVEWISKG